MGEPSGTRTTSSFRVTDMDCPSCVAKIEGHLKTMDGIVSVQASVVSRTLQVEHEQARAEREIQDELGRLGYKAHPATPEEEEPRSSVWRSRKAAITYGAMALFSVGLVLRATGAVALSSPVLVLAALVGGTNFFGKGILAGVRLSLDMNFLMTVAILGALALGEVVEAAAIAFLFSIAELLETYSVDRARASVTALMELAPDTARLLRQGEEVTVPASNLQPGDLIRVRAGERIPGDGQVLAGRSSVDSSPITGESVPLDRTEGDPVFAGTVNLEGMLTIQVDHPASETMLARIGRMIQEAESKRARSEQFVQRFAAYYTPAVTAAAVLVALGPPLLAGAPFQPWILRGLTLLVIACPCALVISTPVAVVSGITAAARKGVLIKGGIHLETLGRIQGMAFDKTGTLTVGHPKVVDVRPQEGFDREEVLWSAAAVEVGSTHPIARAILDEAEDDGWTPQAMTIEDARALPGLGAVAQVDGVETMVGRPQALASIGLRVGHPEDLQTAGATWVAVARNRAFLGWIVVADEPREESREAVAQLRALDVHPLVMLTGDGPEPAEVVGSAVGMDEVRAGLLPEEKVAAVLELRDRWGIMVMVGDGVNDGPALAAADVGVAMGAAGSDVALETADVALLGDRIQRLPYLIRLSRKATRVIRQNVAAAILVKGILALGVPFGWVSLVTAVVLGDMGVSLAVILNALRLGRMDA